MTKTLKKSVLSKIREYIGREVVIYLPDDLKLRGRIEDIESSYHEGVGNLVLRLSEDYQGLKKGFCVIIRGRSIRLITLPTYEE